MVFPSSDALDRKPLDLELRPPLPPRVRVYLYSATDHESERNSGNYRIQVILPTHSRRRKNRARFDRTGAALPLLVGYVHEFDVFVLWDADLEDAGEGIPYSKGAQVHPSTVFAACNGGLGTQARRLRPGRGRTLTETVLAAQAPALASALSLRADLALKTALEL